MNDNLDTGSDGHSRHLPCDERDSVMEMAKLVTNTDKRDGPTGSGKKSRRSVEALTFSLFQCARDGDEHRMKILLKSLGPSVRKKINQQDSDHLTPLHYAVRYNRLNVVKLLVDAGADVHAVDDKGITPLHYAARYRHERRKMRDVSAGISEEDVCVPLPPPPDMDLLEDDSDNERVIEAYRPWEDGLAVLLDHSEDNEFIGQMGSNGLPVFLHYSEQDRGGSVISYLVSKGANINALDARCQTPLHVTAVRGNELACKDLISFKNRIKIDATDSQGITPLHAAAIHSHEEVAHMLIEAGANLMCRDKELCTPLHHAAMEGNLDLVRMLFEAATRNRDAWTISEMVNAMDVESNTALHLAVGNGHYEVTKFLLDKHSDVNRSRNHFMYPLHLAVQSGDVRIVQLLLENHARIDAVNDDLTTALHRAAVLNQAEAAKLLIERGACINCKDKDNCTPLLLTARYGNVEMVEFLLQMGADYTATDKSDKTVIFLAAEFNQLEVLLKLLSYPQLKHLINDSNCCYSDPLHVAAQHGYLEIVQCLLKNGAVLDSKNDEKQTPLHLASKFGRTNVAREMLKHDVNLVCDEDENSNTPLHLAAQYGHSRVAQVLLDFGADVSARNYSRWTPLDLAASKGWTRTCQILLEGYAPVDSVDKNKITPLHLASGCGHAAVVELLLKWEADVTLQDDHGRNCLDRAIDDNHEAVARVIVNSKLWKEALRNVIVDPVTGRAITPMRKLIKKMPEVSQVVFDRCICCGQEKNPDNTEYELTFDYEFLDDVYAKWIQDGLTNSVQDRKSDCASSSGSLYGDHDEEGLPLDAKPYTDDPDVLKNNHPLFIMIVSEREKLLAHPLVTSLLMHKWNTFGRFFYYLSLFIYIIFLTFLTSYMATTDPPHVYGSDGTQIEENQCANLTKQYEQPLCASIGTYVIIALAGFNLLKELLQIYQAKLKYIGWTNVIEWTVYITALLLVISFNECQRITGYRLVWQWNMGAISVFLVWVGLVLYIRKVPQFGIYVVMFTDILRTFSHFFVVFVFFIVAFAMAFFAAFQNKMPFSTLPRSLVKTYVMMIGEFEFDDIFNNPLPGSVIYPEVSYLLFVIFLTSMSILIMNLLVGLAVDDIKAVQEKAALKRMAMLVELALDVEQIIPDFIRRKAFCQKKTLHPNKVHQNPLRRILADTFLSRQALQRSLHPKLNEIGKLQADQEKLCIRMRKVKQSIKTIKEQNHRLESMLVAVLAAQNIRWHEEDFDHDSELDMQEEKDGVL